MQQPFEQNVCAGHVSPAPHGVVPPGHVWPMQVDGSVLGS